MEEDLAKEGIELKPKKARSEAQVKAFEKAREIRLENSKLKKEKIAQVKEEVKNRNKSIPQIAVDDTPKIKKELKEKKIIEEISSRDTPLESEDEVVVVKRKKKPKVIYMEESESEAEPPPVVIKKKKEVPLEPKLEPVLVKPTSTIRFC